MHKWPPKSYDITAGRREEVLFEENGPILSVLAAKEMLGFKTQFRVGLSWPGKFRF